MNETILKILNIITAIIILIPVLFYGLNFITAKTAQTFDSVSICSLSLNSWSENSCYNELWMHTDKIKVCEDLLAESDKMNPYSENYRPKYVLCFYHVATEKGDESICNRIPKGYEQNNLCHEYFKSESYR